MNRFICLSLAVMFIFGVSYPAFAMMCGTGGHSGHEDTAAAATKAVDAKNTTCPVTGDKVDGKTTYEYDGKSYNFCCPMCIDEFKKDPAKYIKKIKAEKE